MSRVQPRFCRSIFAHGIVVLCVAVIAFACGCRSRTVRIMPLGDSITFGAGDSLGGGYRRFLWELLRDSGQPVDFVGTQHNGPDTSDTDHEGHPGWVIKNLAFDPSSCHEWDPLPTTLGPYNDGIANRYRGFVATLGDSLRPDIVLLMIGTNDVLKHTDSVPEIARLYGDLLDTILTVTPRIRILAATIPPLPLEFDLERFDRELCDFGFLDDSVSSANRSIKQVVAARARAGDKISLVDMHSVPGLREQIELGDRVHPAVEGYRLIAGAWYAALIDFLH